MMEVISSRDTPAKKLILELEELPYSLALNSILAWKGKPTQPKSASVLALDTSIVRSIDDLKEGNWYAVSRLLV
jgi:hypothetical protein